MSIRQRMYPSPVEAEAMMLHCAQARYVWNLALEQWNLYRPDKASRGVQVPNNAVRMKQLTEARSEFGWLRAGSSVVHQGALRDFDRAVHGFFGGHKQRPTWRKASDSRQGFVIRDLTIHRISRRKATVLVPKVGPVTVITTRPWPEVQAATSARVTFHNGQWHIALTTPPAPPIVTGTGAVVGIDRGVSNTIATSDGGFEHIPGFTRGEQARFVALQRQLSRQHPGSNRRQVTKNKLARMRQRLTDRRTNWVETTTTQVARAYDLVVLERLNTVGMTKRPSPKPDPDNDGSFLSNGARAKSALNKAILASCWGTFATRLGHKLPEGHLVFVDPRNTSRACPCGHVAAQSRKSQAVFVCVECGWSGHADTNAAGNILGRGLATVGVGTQPEDIRGLGRNRGTPTTASTARGRRRSVAP
ncbi:putative transposase [Yimella lutea]|uniref:Putative transposase n=1 Tax=Yimella lutea TaxID=587872 RepID=A0A542EGS5_9MICO|nr:RNA-guided endonuclease TnpB family protein [Yimella lutea]TQJ14528.1 putative transposase [Yimella lutea]